MSYHWSCAGLMTKVGYMQWTVLPTRQHIRYAELFIKKLLVEYIVSQVSDADSPLPTPRKLAPHCWDDPGLLCFRRRIQYPYATTERVPMWLLLIIAVACPLVIMPCINLLTVRSLWDWHNSWLGLVLSFGLTGTITNIVKVSLSKHIIATVPYYIHRLRLAGQDQVRDHP